VGGRGWSVCGVAGGVCVGWGCLAWPGGRGGRGRPGPAGGRDPVSGAGGEDKWGEDAGQDGACSSSVLDMRRARHEACLECKKGGRGGSLETPTLQRQRGRDALRCLTDEATGNRHTRRQAREATGTRAASRHPAAWYIRLRPRCAPPRHARRMRCGTLCGDAAGDTPGHTPPRRRRPRATICGEGDRRGPRESLGSSSETGGAAWEHGDCRHFQSPRTSQSSQSRQSPGPASPVSLHAPHAPHGDCRGPSAARCNGRLVAWSPR
jgi:hypothetical protein